MVEESERSLQYLMMQCSIYNVQIKPPQDIAGFSNLL